MQRVACQDRGRVRPLGVHVKRRGETRMEARWRAQHHHVFCGVVLMELEMEMKRAGTFRGHQWGHRADTTGNYWRHSQSCLQRFSALTYCAPNVHAQPRLVPYAG